MGISVISISYKVAGPAAAAVGLFPLVMVQKRLFPDSSILPKCLGDLGNPRVSTPAWPAFKKEKWNLHSREGPTNISTYSTLREDLATPLNPRLQCSRRRRKAEEQWLLPVSVAVYIPGETGRLHLHSTFVWLSNELFLGVFLLEWEKMGMGRRGYKQSMTLKAVAGFENLFALGSSGTPGPVILTCQASVSSTVTWEVHNSYTQRNQGCWEELKQVNLCENVWRRLKQCYA